MSLTLERLHTVIQRAMGWQNAHLYEFEVQDRRCGVPEPEEPEYEVEPVWKITLREAAPAEGTSFRCVYDLGDDWTHEILAERIATPDKPLRHPLCLAGARRCPPRGLRRAARVRGLAGRAARSRPSRSRRHGSVGQSDGFDPGAFDLAAVNRKLRLLK